MGLTGSRYGAVTRSVNAYVPPGARRTPFGGVSDPAPKSDIPQVAVNAPDGAPVLPEASTGKGSPATSKVRHISNVFRYC